MNKAQADKGFGQASSASGYVLDTWYSVPMHRIGTKKVWMGKSTWEL